MWSTPPCWWRVGGWGGDMLGTYCKKAKLSMCLINYALGHEDVWRSGNIDPPILDSALDGCVVSFTPQPLYPLGNSLRYPLDRKLGGLQSRSGLCEGQTLFPLPGIESRPPTRSSSLWCFTQTIWLPKRRSRCVDSRQSVAASGSARDNWPQY
jgi:hypothetical protein